MNTALQHICLFIYCICLHLWLTYVDVPMCSQEMINDNHTNAWKSLWCQIMQLNLVAVNTVRTHLKHYSFPNTSHRILIIIITIITIIIIIIIIIIMIIMIRQFIRCHNMSMKSLQVTTLLQSDAAFTYLLTYLICSICFYYAQTHLTIHYYLYFCSDQDLTLNEYQTILVCHITTSFQSYSQVQ